MDIPVYLIAGFLDAGKTNFINGILKDGFAAEDKTLLISARRGRRSTTPTGCSTCLPTRWRIKRT